MSHTYNDVPGAGTSLKLTITATPTLIPGVHEISWDGFSVAVRNPTALDDTSVQKRPGLPNFGDVKFKTWHDPNNTVHQALVAKVTGATPTQALDTWTLTYNDEFVVHANFVITGFLTEYNESGIEPETGTIIREGTIAVNAVAYTAGAAS